MSAPHQTHLNADALDAIHEGNPASNVLLHLETCADCQALLALDSRLLAALSALPALEPSAGFTDAVLERVAESRPTRTTVATTQRTDREVSARRRVLVGGLVGGGLVTAGFAWAFTDPGAALGLAEPAFSNMTAAVWTSVQALGANAAEQPWFSPIVDAVATPGRALPAIAAVVALYAAGLTMLRRLLTRPAADAGW